MSPALSEVVDALQRFTISKEPQAILLSGKWGSGKTYFWNNFLTAVAPNAADLFEKYSYVSAFGITSLSELRDAVFDNAITFGQLDEGATPRSFLEHSLSVTSESEIKPIFSRWKGLARALYDEGESRARRYSKVIQAVPGIDKFGTAFRSAAYLSIHHYLVCVDDIERRGKELSIRELFGLISTLREQRDCSVIVILNLDVLDEKDRLELDTLREKIFDYEIVFEPRPRECARVVFTADLPYAEQTVRFCEKLQITNIRVLRRIKAMVDLFYPYVQKLDGTLLEQLIQSGVLLTWSFNTKRAEVPPYDYIKRLNFGFFLELGEKKITKEQRAWNDLISDYGYRETDEFDGLLCQYLEKGIFDKQRLEEVLAAKQEAAIQANLLAEVSKAWNIFNSSFDDDGEKFVKQLTGSLRKGIDWVAVGDVSQATKLLRELGFTTDADEITALWVDTQKRKRPEALNLENEPFLSELRDPALLKAMAAAYASVTSLPPLESVVRSIAADNGWGLVDEQVLGAATDEDFYRLFKSLHEEQLPIYVRACLKFEKFAGVSEGLKNAVQNAKIALRRIGEENQLNRVRVRRYGVLDSESAEQKKK